MKTLHLNRSFGVHLPVSTPHPFSPGVDFWNQSLSPRLQSVLDTLAGCHSSEPHISQHHDRQGHTWFEVYDRPHNQHLSFSSEAEVRIWLDRRFYDSSYT